MAVKSRAWAAVDTNSHARTLRTHFRVVVVVVVVWRRDFCAICSASCNGVWLWKRTEGNVSENIPFSTSALLVIGQA